MSKSRNGGSKGSRSNSTESEDSSQQRLINSPLLSTSDTLGTNGNSFVLRNESTVPSSPPPSYQHVLEETRMRQSADNEGEEEMDEVEEYTKKQGQALKRYKPAVSGEGGGGSGCGPGGGGRQPVKGTEILHKSSKEFYRAVAKQWGITCKMSDHCRCFDCQSHYFDCEYDKDEHGKTDGGLGAGTPMFLTSMIHGTSCVLL
ncbi:uncharacterized protein LOC124947784 [Vespa velutina]|uniref:uncharacterized protein LOC124422659 n=1 Tax=Vespa crabro TaxID=7445 RepID=UPI001EFFA759|nr:uncharacterized protein LOC124422659 [Vespa crabro]XP_046815399.1 uncharacterized protein LOC124422659 [Vespa crabro]XP_046815400.1 uncharacterized protein LOC124422659 [Vespa crabro]XP_047346370.1 uncharacterized protein LOC124947784 [Vespa velutina]XP_047346371.1 uncharacterized protein LOC124947784 [Vespa velutina]XP_047346372.1 uncharacterized protein LOC124947784 [Vespa velutina]XP_047346373.1 uncharacterized protein LOC124947784 [Vespa velutina]XP_047346374.1 uncharacterized protein